MDSLSLRHSAGLIDVSPLFKLEIRGPRATDLLALLTVRDVRKLRTGRMVYLCWCDDEGKVIDDGTVARLGKETFRLTAAEPSLAWLSQVADPFDVEIERADLVMGSVVVSHDYFKRFLAQLRIIVGGRIKSYEPLLDRARREAVLRMKEQALARGHHTVVNIRLETSRLANSQRGGKGTAGVEMLAYGTALTVREGL